MGGLLERTLPKKKQSYKKKIDTGNDFIGTEYRTAKNTECHWGFGVAQYHDSGMTQFNLSRQDILNNRRISTELEYFSNPKSKRYMATNQFVLDMPYRERDNVCFSVQHLHLRDQSEKAYVSNAQ